MKNIERFNLYTAHIFGMLYASFPVARMVHAQEVVNAIQDSLELAPGELEQQSKFFVNTMMWLEETGYIKSRGAGQDRKIVLMPKAFEALNATLSALEGKKAKTDEKSVGARLSEVATEAGKEMAKETWKQAASEMVGQVIGHAAKVFTSP
jgi:hypothetical protein